MLNQTTSPQPDRKRVLTRRTVGALAVMVITAAFAVMSLELPVAQDQCDALKTLLANLNKQLEMEQQALGSQRCEGSARSFCQRRIQSLLAQIRLQTLALRNCRNGVIPVGGGPAPPPHLPFDLTPRSVDDFDHALGSENPRWDYFNGTHKNPLWAYQLYEKQLPNPETHCGASSLSYNVSDWARCTRDAVWINQAKCAGGGHVNWWPVMYTGDIYWQDHSWNDDDYNFHIYRNDPVAYGSDHALYTTANPEAVAMEFDSDETIDPFSDVHQWWRKLRTAVDAGNGNPADINGKKAVAIGLLGLDYAHNSSTELHPIYVLAINTEGQKWSFFFRNWGNEGYCSHGTTRWTARTLRLLLENTAAIDGRVGANTVFGTAGTSIAAFFVSGRGVVLEVELPAPSENGYVVGDLELEWTPAPLSNLRARQAASKRLTEGFAADAQLEEFFKKTPAARRRLVQANSELAKSRRSSLASPLPLQVRPRLDTPLPTSAFRLELSDDSPSSRARKDQAICSALGPERVRFPELCKS